MKGDRTSRSRLELALSGAGCWGSGAPPTAGSGEVVSTLVSGHKSSMVISPPLIRIVKMGCFRAILAAEQKTSVAQFRQEFQGCNG